MNAWKSGGTNDPIDDPRDVRLVMGPGLVRCGRRLPDEPGERGLLSAAFRSDEPHYLAVGSRVVVGPEAAPRPMVVVRRSERKGDRVYDFRDEAADSCDDGGGAAAPRRGAPFVRRVDLCFGPLALPVTTVWIDAPHVGVALSLDDERLLAAADLVELRLPVHDGRPPARIWGWIRERELAAARVVHSLECPRELSEHYDVDWRRIVASAEQSLGAS